MKNIFHLSIGFIAFLILNLHSFAGPKQIESFEGKLSLTKGGWVLNVSPGEQYFLQYSYVKENKSLVEQFRGKKVTIEGAKVKWKEKTMLQNIKSINSGGSSVNQPSSKPNNSGSLNGTIRRTKKGFFLELPTKEKYLIEYSYVKLNKEALMGMIGKKVSIQGALGQNKDTKMVRKIKSIQPVL